MMKQLFTLLLGVGLVCPVFSQIKTKSVEIDDVSSTTVNSDFTPSTDATRSSGTSSLRWLNVHGRRILASAGSNSGFGFETDATYVAKHWITANDGGGNLNFRFANRYQSGVGDIQTEQGYAMHWQWHNTQGWFKWQTTESANTVGTNIASSFRTVAQINPSTKEWIFPLSDWTIKSESTIDGPKVEVNEITNRAGTGSPSFPHGITSSEILVDEISNLAGTGSPSFPNGITSGDDLDIAGNLQIQESGYIDDDPVPGGLNDDYIRLNGHVELRSSSDEHGIQLFDTDNTQYLSIIQRNGSAYFSDNTTYSNYFLRGAGANVHIRGDMYVNGNDIHANSGALRLNGEGDVRIAMDHNGNDSNTRKILFGKHGQDAGSPWQELMSIEEAGDVVVSGGGTLRVDEISNISGSGGPSFSNGLSVSNLVEMRSSQANASQSEAVILNMTSRPVGGAADNLFQFIQKNNSDASKTYAVLRMGDEFTNAGTPSKVVISTKGDSYFNGGDVGINTSNPTADLEVVGTVKSTTLEATSVIKVGNSQLKKLNISGTSGAPGATKDIVINASNSHVFAEVTIIGMQTNSKNENVFWHGIVTYDNNESQVKAMTIASSKMSATAIVSGGNVILRLTDNSVHGYSELRGSAIVHP